MHASGPREGCQLSPVTACADTTGRSHEGTFSWFETYYQVGAHSSAAIYGRGQRGKAVRFHSYFGNFLLGGYVYQLYP